MVELVEGIIACYGEMQRELGYLDILTLIDIVRLALDNCNENMGLYGGVVVKLDKKRETLWKILCPLLPYVHLWAKGCADHIANLVVCWFICMINTLIKFWKLELLQGPNNKTNKVIQLLGYFGQRFSSKHLRGEFRGMQQASTI